ncbi:DMT family transporter [Flavobacterium sp. MK4S-17]|uniref:DMT family transporter n=1 Tax=Flavobacterium sp. MK4S-17 TaxID=2543737 RepID=UPI00135AFEDA|nr:DMT family transporter [Flavobacterium sp. MK4S-17]
MLYLIFSIICSVTVGVIFKIVKRYPVHITQIIFWNYACAIMLCYLVFAPDLSTVDSSAPWHIYLPLAIMLPSVFLFLAASIKYMGIVKTDAAQRLSLIIPILASYFIFAENFNILKIIGLLIGFPAILLILSKKDSMQGNRWVFPVVVLLGFGIIDVLFKQIAIAAVLPFTTSLLIIFCGALIISLLVLVKELVLNSKKLKAVNFLFGLLVGAFNFGNILFYLQAHKAYASNPSTVFASMNIGVIVVGSLAGILLFKEKMSILNYAGLILAVAAILFITLSQVY